MDTKGTPHRPGGRTEPSSGEAVQETRRRVQVSFSDSVLLLLGHVSTHLGLTLAQICENAVLQDLPALIERADTVKRRANELSQQARKK